MAEQLSACPECHEAYTYENGALLVCPMCGHEWSPEADSDTAEGAQPVIRDAVGTVLNDGGAVAIVKDLKVKGAGGVVRGGTKGREIRL
ncbi:MAG: alkylphosphonate utilization protein, partial [Yaniella sp.]|nr:alkylphosphonate utilization protein [Yaniella sp.]